MALTTLDEHTALIVIDLQQGLMGTSTAHPLPQVVQHAAQLAAAFRSHALPVVLVTVVGVAPGRAEQSRSLRDLPANWATPVPELNQQPSDHLVLKRRWGAFTGTDLAAFLSERGVTQVVLAGVSTSAGVESTARHAHELGLNVTLALDAMTDSNPDAHANSVARIFPRLGESGTTREILELLTATR